MTCFVLINYNPQNRGFQSGCVRFCVEFVSCTKILDWFVATADWTIGGIICVDISLSVGGILVECEIDDRWKSVGKNGTWNSLVAGGILASHDRPGCDHQTWFR